MKNLHKDSSVAALIIFAIALFISGEYALSIGLFSIGIIVINVKSSRESSKVTLLSWS